MGKSTAPVNPVVPAYWAVSAVGAVLYSSASSMWGCGWRSLVRGRAAGFDVPQRPQWVDIW
ncbi:hypothetical protein [Nocardia salmonicida]|uniref:Uncharacterized protein n=1 Tax=Nocardia salmonicida TaxID=53431 RepID=A0ABZ1NAW7_9NOCA|nr:hypothetical protein [Nocardia salmonicida]